MKILEILNEARNMARSHKAERKIYAMAKQAFMTRGDDPKYAKSMANEILSIVVPERRV